MTKIKKSELGKLLKTVESSNEEMYNQLYSLNHRILEFSSELALYVDGWAPKTSTLPDVNGIYTGKVTVNGIPKGGNNGLF